MMFLGKKTMRRFTKMITPMAIDVSTERDNVLYVQNWTGEWLVLTFETHEQLAEAMLQLRDYGRTSCFCDYEYYNISQIKKEEQTRELEYDDYEYDLEIDR